jgi:hypothetical protein
MAAPVIAAGVVLALVLVTSWRIRAVRLFTVLTVAALVTLLVSPSWFPQYTDFVAAPFAICAAAAVEALPTGYRLAGCLPPLAATALTTSLLINGNFPTTAPWHTTPDLVAAARGQRCTMSDSPSGLIGLDVLDHDLNNGCRNWVDVIGRTYLGRDKGPMPRTTNAAWQRDLAGYLRSGQAAYLSLFGRQLTRDTYRLVIKDGVLAQAGSGGLIKRIYRIAHPLSGRQRRTPDAVAQEDACTGLKSGNGERLQQPP